MNLADFRRAYAGPRLEAADLNPDPFQQFGLWFDDASKSGTFEPNAMILATSGETGTPTQRCVLLKHWDTRGFVFFSNYESRKARHLEKHPQASVLFAWLGLERQLSICGHVEKTTRKESETYFRTRPRDSQIGAWASHQSAVIESREELENAFLEISEKHAGQEIPTPPFWGGYRLVPSSFELWQGGPARLHDRFIYTRDAAGNWGLRRLSP